jgi:DUF4097 and DUF4098 domain-containing protein YvlB
MFRSFSLPAFAGWIAVSSLTGCSIPRFEHVRLEKQTLETQPLDASEARQPITKIDLSTFNGPIDVKPHDQSLVSMEIEYKAYGESEEEAELNADKLSCEYAVEDGVLSIRATKPREQWMASAGFKILIPRGCGVQLATSNGRVSVSDIDAAVAIDTSNGTITCTQIMGNVDAKSSNGTIELQRCQGSVSLKTSNGRVSYSGYLMGNENKIQSSNGRISIALDPQQAVEIESDTSNGKIQCSLPTQRILKESKKHYYAMVGEGPSESAAKLSVRTSNGSINIDPISDDLETPSEIPANIDAEISDASEAIAL